MDDLREISGKIHVPANTGIEGFIQTLRQLLKRPLIQEVKIDSRGAVTFRQYVREGEEQDQRGGNNFGVDLTALEPYHIIRNAPLVEWSPPGDLPAPVAVGMLFDTVAGERLAPLAFASGAETQIWRWYQATTGCSMSHTQTFFGFPLLLDRQIPDTALVLCCGISRNSAFLETRMSYKMELPVPPTLPKDEVKVLP